MFKKKFKLVEEKLTLHYDDDNSKYIGFSYNATISLRRKEERILELVTTMIIDDTRLCPQKFCLFLRESTDKRDELVLISHFIKERDAMILELIEIKNETLRNQGLGTIILTTWLRLLPKYSELYNISFSKIEGTVGEGGNFTSKFAKKLYRQFNNYKYTQTQRLKLNKRVLKHGQLEYILK